MKPQYHRVSPAVGKRIRYLIRFQKKYNKMRDFHPLIPEKYYVLSAFCIVKHGGM